MGWWAPFAKGRGAELKAQLVRAAITAMDAIWSEDQNVRFIQVDPILRRVAKLPASAQAKKMEATFKEVVFQAWDMLAGKVSPELGGHPKYLDIIGINYYWVNQEWIVGNQRLQQASYQTMPWDSPDRVTFKDLAQQLYDRYQRPMVVTETGSFGDKRQQWWRLMLQQVDEALQAGLPLHGVCSYPTLDKPHSLDWLEPNSGLWDFKFDDTECTRIPHTAALAVVDEYVGKWGTGL